MEQLVDKGLCKAIGISNFTAKKTKTLLETAKIVPACNQGRKLLTVMHWLYKPCVTMYRKHV